MFGIGSRGMGLVCLLVGVGLGCGDDGSGDGGTTTLVGDSSGSGPANAAPTVVGQVDLEWACSEPDATRVELQATRVGCVNPPPAPCTLPQMPRPVVGDGVDCPAATSPQALRVEVEQAGRYHVELVRLAGETELRRVCFGEDGGEELLVTEDDLASKPTYTVALLDGMPCG